MTSTPTSLSAIVFDWAGTILDFGSCAPMGALVRLFEKFGVNDEPQNRKRAALADAALRMGAVHPSDFG